MRITLLAFSVLFWASCQPGGRTKEEHPYGDLISKIDSIVQENEFNGVVSLVSDSMDIYQKAFGYGDFRSQSRLSLRNRFVIGSISKQITAVLLMREYEKGRLNLHDTIADYLPEIQQPWSKQVTIHQLLTHTHGIVSMDQPLEFEPGSQFHYSQLGYHLLSQILERVTGSSFADLSTALFSQEGLKNTHFPNPEGFLDLVVGHEENENGDLEPVTNSLENYPAAGSFISNASDLNRWNQLLHSGELVQEESLQLMKTRYATRVHPIFGEVDYGYGLLFQEGEQDLEIGALGYAPGFVSASYYYPKSKLNLVVLQNTARNLDDFRQTFQVHTALMELVKDAGGKGN